MEARQTLKGSAVPKALLIVLAMCAAVILAIGASFIAKDFAGSSSTSVPSAHPAAGTVLRQDYQGPTGAAHPAPGTVLRQDYQGPTGAAQSGATVKHKNVEQMPGFRD